MNGAALPPRTLIHRSTFTDHQPPTDRRQGLHEGSREVCVRPRHHRVCRTRLGLASKMTLRRRFRVGWGMAPRMKMATTANVTENGLRRPRVASPGRRRSQKVMRTGKPYGKPPQNANEFGGDWSGADKTLCQNTISSRWGRATYTSVYPIVNKPGARACAEISYRHHNTRRRNARQTLRVNAGRFRRPETETRVVLGKQLHKALSLVFASPVRHPSKAR